MRLRHIEVFQAVMETGSMSGAARLINLTQSAVSRVIANAESQLGYPLFKRTGGKLVPTAEGLALFEESAGLFERLEALRRTARNLKTGASGSLRIGAIPAISHKLLPDVLASYCRAYPDVRCEVRTIHKRQMTDALLARDIDVGLDFYAIQHPGIESVQYGEGPLYVMGPPHLTELLGRSKAPLIEVLKQIPYVALVGDDPIAINADQFLAQAHFPEAAVRVQTSQLAEELVARGLGWALIDFLTARQADRNRLSVLPLQPAVACPLNVFLLRNQPTGLAARSFFETLAATLKTREPW